MTEVGTGVPFLGVQAPEKGVTIVAVLPTGPDGKIPCVQQHFDRAPNTSQLEEFAVQIRRLVP